MGSQTPLPKRRVSDPSWWIGQPTQLPGVRLRVTQNILTAGALFHVAPSRWQVRFTTEGMDLLDGRRGHQLIGWDDPWKSETNLGRSSYAVRVCLPGTGELEGSKPRVHTLTGGAWSVTGGMMARYREVTALADFLRDNPAHREGLTDPDRCNKLVAQLSLRVPGIRRSLTAPALDDLIAEQVGQLSHGRRLPLQQGRRVWSSDDLEDLTDEITAHLSPYDRPRLKHNKIKARVREFLSQDPWPFHVLDVATPLLDDPRVDDPWGQ